MVVFLLTQPIFVPRLLLRNWSTLYRCRRRRCNVRLSAHWRIGPRRWCFDRWWSRGTTTTRALMLRCVLSSSSPSAMITSHFDFATHVDENSIRNSSALNRATTIRTLVHLRTAPFTKDVATRLDFYWIIPGLQTDRARDVLRL